MTIEKISEPIAENTNRSASGAGEALTGVALDQQMLPADAKVVHLVEAADGRHYPVSAEVAQMLETERDAVNQRKLRRGRPSLPTDEGGFRQWLQEKHPAPLSARSLVEWFWAYQAVATLTAAPGGAERFAWLLESDPPKITALAAIGRFAKRHGPGLAIQIAGVICKKTMSVPKAVAHMRKAMELFDASLAASPVIRPAAFDHRPSSGAGGAQ